MMVVLKYNGTELRYGKAVSEKIFDSKTNKKEIIKTALFCIQSIPIKNKCNDWIYKPKNQFYCTDRLGAVESHKALKQY